MRPLRRFLAFALVTVSLMAVPWPASAEDQPTAQFTPVSRSFTPNGDGRNDTFEATLSVSDAARVRISAINGGMEEVLVDRTVEGAASIPVSWDGRIGGQPVPSNRAYTVAATIEWAAGGMTRRTVEPYPYTSDQVELRSPGAGALLFGDVPIVWKTHVYWQFHFTISDCGSFDQYLGESGSQYPNSFDFSALNCSPGPHTLTATGHPGWGMGSESLTVASIPVVIPGDGPQLVLQPDLAQQDKVQTLQRYADGRVAPISWPVRCRGADPSSFVLRIRNADSEVVATLRELGGPESDVCRSGAITPGKSWDGRDEDGVAVPEGRYTVEAEITDAAGHTASDRAEVDVKEAEAPLVLTSVSAGDEVGAQIPLVFEVAPQTSFRSISVKLSGCERRQPYGWYVGPTDARPVRQSIDVSRCPAGARELSWSADWTDADGVQRVFTQRVPITLRDETAPALQQRGYGTLLTPSAPDKMIIYWFLTCADVSPVELSVVVRDRSGAEVRTLRALSPSSCADWESNSSDSLSWDGKDDDGSVAPAGSYVAVARATDAAGNTSESSWTITVDPRAPYRSSVEADGEVGPDDVITWTPRDGVTAITDDPYPRASARLQGPEFGTAELPVSFDPAGRFEVRGVGTTCIGRQATLTVSIDWRADDGSTHTWDESIPIRCAGAAEAPPLAGTITGTAQTGQTLRAQVEGAQTDEQPTYRWQRDGRDIAGATRDRYTLTAADVGHAVRVGIRVAGPPVRSAVSPPVQVRPGVLVASTPTVRGTSRVGRILTAASSAWRPTGVTLSYQWLRNGRPITRATTSRYQLTSADRGTRIAVRVTGRKSGFVTTTRTSAPTTTVA